MIQVLVVSPYGSVRAGLRSMLSGSAEVLVVAEAAGLEDASRLASVWSPDVLVLEIGSGVRPELPPEIGIVALFETRDEIDWLLARGSAVACLTREADSVEMLAAVHAVALGLVVIAPSLLPEGVARTNSDSFEALTTRELEVLTLMAEGMPNKQIAAELGLSLHTVKFHAAAIFAKLGAASRTEAVTQGIRFGLLSV